MSFATRDFFLFLPVVLLGYYLLRGRGPKYAFLLGASWFFYMSFNPWLIWVILFTTGIDYAAGLLIASAPTPALRRRWLLLSIVSNLGFLAAFKYTGFLARTGTGLAALLGWDLPPWTVDIALPLGISFHTFQGISYTLDVYRGKIPAVRNPVDFALFVAFFPQLVAGPIVRAVEFLPQMDTPPRATAAQVIEGLHWFLLGLFKKVFIADRLAQFVDPVFASPDLFDAASLRWAVLAYAAQIYCDFSGYSDLALGCAKFFGFELPINFHFPYLADSIADFWRRWHVSLSTWMRDYVYIGLGGNRRGSLRTYLNLLATLTLCGLWHGASWNYVLWGFYNGVLLALHRLWDTSVTGRPALDRLRSTVPYRALGIAGTFLLVAVGLVLVRSQTWPGCWLVQGALFGLGPVTGEHWLPVWVPLLVGLVAAGHLFSGFRDLRCGLLASPEPVRALAYTAAIVLLLVFGPGASKAFIYFQF